MIILPPGFRNRGAPELPNAPAIIGLRAPLRDEKSAKSAAYSGWHVGIVERTDAGLAIRLGVLIPWWRLWGWANVAALGLLGFLLIVRPGAGVEMLTGLAIAAFAAGLTAAAAVRGLQWLSQVIWRRLLDVAAGYRQARSPLDRIETRERIEALLPRLALAPGCLFLVGLACVLAGAPG